MRPELLKTPQVVRSEHMACPGHEETKYGVCRKCGHGYGCQVCPPAEHSSNGRKP